MNTELNAEAPAALECAGLRKSFAQGSAREVRAVDDLSLTVRSGETVALLGPSGCGKTTTLRLIAGFEWPDMGRVVIAGREVVGAGAFLPPERRRVGMVFQDYALFPHLTVADNVAYGLENSTVGRWTPALRRPLAALRGRFRFGSAAAAAIDARVQEALELVALPHVAGRFPHELSGGEAQRVALARALAPGPALLLLDEPFSNLDAPLRASVRSEVREILRRASTASIFVTHDQEEAFAIADRVAVQLRGRIEQVGSPVEIYHRPATRSVAAFVGEADFLPGTLTSDGVETEIGRIPIEDDSGAAAGSVDVMLRPERVQLAAAGATGPGHGQAVVERREFYGHDQLVTLRLDSGARIRARLGPDADFPPGRRASVFATGAGIVYPPLSGAQGPVLGE